MVISICFSVVIYRVLTLELDRLERTQRMRFERQFFDQPFNGEFHFFRFDPNIIKEMNDRLRLSLALINLVIFASSAGVGYFLAGKTLWPIEEMVEEQKRFVADASHELRTPLTAMKTEIEVTLKDKKLDLKQAKQLLESNLEEVDKMQSLSNILLNLSRYQNSNVKLNFEKIKMSEVIAKVLPRFKGLANNKNIEVSQKAEDFEIEVNRISVTELLSILLDNAIKYSQEGGKIVIRTHREGRSGILEVQDFGLGIKEEEIPNLFSRFYRADNSRSKSKTDGYGLGLSIAKNIVELHEGKITVNSVFGKGSTFVVKLPLRHFTKTV